MRPGTSAARDRCGRSSAGGGRCRQGCPTLQPVALWGPRRRSLAPRVPFRTGAVPRFVPRLACVGRVARGPRKSHPGPTHRGCGRRADERAAVGAVLCRRGRPAPASSAGGGLAVPPTSPPRASSWRLRCRAAGRRPRATGRWNGCCWPSRSWSATPSGMAGRRSRRPSRSPTTSGCCGSPTPRAGNRLPRRSTATRPSAGSVWAWSRPSAARSVGSRSRTGARSSGGGWASPTRRDRARCPSLATAPPTRSAPGRPSSRRPLVRRASRHRPRGPRVPRGHRPLVHRWPGRDRPHRHRRGHHPARRRTRPAAGRAGGRHLRCAARSPRAARTDDDIALLALHASTEG
ncbi:MAG: hypothetical protein JWO98_510 [Frankiales bacterium]|nr:hypothetical protein [Frankiales bacterium]